MAKQIPVITKEQLLAFHAKADALREEILNTPNMEIPEGSTVYYLSPNGNDNDDGRSPATAWKTIARLKAATLPYGAYVCFERGGMWRGKFDATAGVTYTAYGEGPKPELRGSMYDGAVDGWWDEVAPNIWRYSKTFPGDVGMIVMNHGEENGIKMLMNYTEEQTKEVVSKRDWNGYISLEKNYEFVHDLGERHMKNSNIENPGYVYMYCDKGNPATVFDSIEFIDLVAIISIRKRDDITIDNLCLKYSNFGVSGGKDNLHIRNCEIGWIGGCIQGYTATGYAWRYGNGVEIYGGCLNFVCDHNWVYQCYDAGLTQQHSARGTNDVIMDGVFYTRNLIEKCVYSLEYFLGKPEEGATPTRYMANFHIKDNLLLDAGGFGMQRPEKSSPAHIKGWDHMNTVKGEFIIENNLLMCSEKMMIHTACEKQEDAPVYRNNVFVQYDDGQWGRHGVKPTTLQMYTDDVAEQYPENDFYVIK